MASMSLIFDTITKTGLRDEQVSGYQIGLTPEGTILGQGTVRGVGVIISKREASSSLYMPVLSLLIESSGTGFAVVSTEPQVRWKK